MPTLVATGGGADYFEQGADFIAGAVPDAERVPLTGQEHLLDPERFAPVLAEFLSR